jgi:hypothetical protein
MNWRSVAAAIGRFMVFVSNARQLRNGSDASPGGHGGGGGAALALLLALPVYAGESQSPPAYFADGLTAQSSWAEIAKTRGIRAELPYVGFGTMYVSLRSLCVDGDMLAIADRRVDNGLRVSAERIGGRGPAPAATGPSSAARADAAGRTSSDADRPSSVPLAYSVDVYRIIETGLSPTRVFLFRKAWEVPICPAR